MSDTWVRVATPEDAGCVVRIIKDGFDPDIIDLTIYCCAGMEEYVARTSALGPIAPTVYLLAGQGDSALGAAEIGRHNEDLVLSYISTAASARRRGVGKALMVEATRLNQGDGGQMQLDVMVDNLPARSWYESLGFATLGTRAWWSLPTTASSTHGWTALGLPQADLSQAALGFSEFEIRHAKGRWRVGRFGDVFFRLTEPGALADPVLLSALSELDPRRSILYLGAGDDPSVPAHATLLATAHRMAVPLHELAIRLGTV